MRTSKPSATACMIAASLAADHGSPERRLWVPPLAPQLGPHFLAAYGPPASYFASALSRPWLRVLGRGLETATIPGITLHFLLRKRFIRDVVIQRLDSQTIRQIVILGAGFDTLCLELHSRYPSVSFLELDHPATQTVKRAALEGRFSALDNLVWVPADFSIDGLEQILLRCRRYRRDIPTLFLAEGVLMYLSESDIDKIFFFIRDHSGRQSQFVFTFMEKNSRGRVNFQARSFWVDAWMKIRGEPFTWGIEKECLAKFLDRFGFSLRTIGDAAAFRESYLAPQGKSHRQLAVGESVAVVDKQDKPGGGPL